MSEKMNIPCEVIEDLLPSYIDGLTSPVTTELVRKHLESCESCRRKYQEMTGTLPEITEEDHAEIDYLKKTRKRTVQSMIASIAAIAAVIAVCFGLKYLLIGAALDPSHVAYTLNVSRNMVTIEGQAAPEYPKNIRFREKDGTVEISFSGIIGSVSGNHSFSESRTFSDEIKEVVIGDRIVWSDGNHISPIASDTYRYVHEYCGDMPASIAFSEALGLSYAMGSYTNMLEAEEHPYTWTIMFDQKVRSEYQEQVETQLVRYGSVLLGGIGNLDEIRFEYNTDEGLQTFALTAEEVKSYFRINPKQSCRSISAYEDLLRAVGFSTNVYYEPADSFYCGLQVINFTEESISSISLSADKFNSTGMNADMTPLKKGSELTFDISEQELNSLDPMTQITLTLHFVDGEEYEIKILKDQLTPGRKAVIKLTGSREEGFRAEQ